MRKSAVGRACSWRRSWKTYSAQPYDALPTFNGNRIYDQTTPSSSSYSVDLTVFLAALGLQQIQAVLVDLRTNRELCRVTTLRADR